ncbi:MAG: hypothetical protein ACOYNL_04280 [Rickettsiales bacterium]
MRKRNMLAVLLLVIGAGASFYCYSRLAQLLPMSDPAAVTRTEATIVSVNTPVVKKGQTITDVVNDVRFMFTAGGKKIEGGYNLKDRTKAPEKGAKEPVAYLTARPQVFLRGAEYDTLPKQLGALRFMMWGFALAAMVLPFAVMNHR